MKDLPQRPQPPLPHLGLPREPIILQAADAQREAPDGDHRQHVVRARSVRRRLFADDDSAGQDGGASGEAGRRRRRVLWPGAGPDDPTGAYYMARRVQDSLDKLLADETAAASRRWNFDFENERPLEGQWQWEKVEELVEYAPDDSCDHMEEQPVDDCHSPQR